MKGSMVQGSIKKGVALLVGILRCGHCSRKMLVHYNGSKAVRYHCVGAMINHGTGACISFGSLRVEQTIEKVILEAISPLGIQAALKASNQLETRYNDTYNQKMYKLEQAQYEAERMRRQFDSVEPENRLVASELETRWNNALKKVMDIEDEINKIPKNEDKINQEEKNLLMKLGENIKQIWFEKLTSVVIKKAIIRELLQEIIANIDGEKIILILHWKGGDHTKIDVVKNKAGHHRWTTDKETSYIIESLSRYLSDQKIASLLNKLKRKTAKGHIWNQSRIKSFRSHHKIVPYQLMEYHKRGELMVSEAAKQLNIRAATLLKFIKKGSIQAKQICSGAPWILLQKHVDNFIKKRKMLKE